MKNEPKIKPAPCFAIVHCVLGRVTVKLRKGSLGGTRGRALEFKAGKYVATFFRPGEWT
jgi:hypothetical protein